MSGLLMVVFAPRTQSRPGRAGTPHPAAGRSETAARQRRQAPPDRSGYRAAVIGMDGCVGRIRPALLYAAWVSRRTRCRPCTPFREGICEHGGQRCGDEIYPSGVEKETGGCIEF